MTRYYYTCPIKAAYMSEYHGLNFEAIDYKTDISEPLDTKELLDFDYYLACQQYPKENKIYLKKCSEYLTCPKVNDLAHYDLNGGSGVYQFTDKAIRWAEGVTNIQIIRRDNKQFFMPEVEND